jgi:ABC-type polysaccharide/polyol phosphate export permease
VFQIPYLQRGTPELGDNAMRVLLVVVTLVVGYRVFTNAEDDFVYYV